MINHQEALKKVLRLLEPLGTEKVKTSKAIGRILGEDVISGISIPPFDKAAMDGFAVRAEDIEELPAQLKVVGEVSAGQFPDFPIKRGECVKISTGAPLPEEANEIAVAENVKEIGKNEIEVLKPSSGNVCVKGEDLKEGEVAVERGQRLTPLKIGIAASAGQDELIVYKRPTIALLCTGGEIREPSEETKKGQIYNANGSMLSSLLEPLSSKLTYLGIARDEKKELSNKIQNGLKYDLLIISGGVSVGKHDLVPDVLKNLGVKKIFHRWAVKPGMPTFFGIKDKTAVFAMPGNPQSCFVVFKILVEPAIVRMSGASDIPPIYKIGEMAESFVDESDRKHFMPCKIKTENGTNIIERVPYHGSADIRGTSSADGFFVIPLEVKQIKKGQVVEFFEI